MIHIYKCTVLIPAIRAFESNEGLETPIWWDNAGQWRHGGTSSMLGTRATLLVAPLIGMGSQHGLLVPLTMSIIRCLVQRLQLSHEVSGGWGLHGCPFSFSWLLTSIPAALTLTYFDVSTTF